MVQWITELAGSEGLVPVSGVMQLQCLFLMEGGLLNTESRFLSAGVCVQAGETR